MIELTHHHHFHFDERSARLFHEFIELLGKINRKVNTIMATMQDLQASVERNTSAEQGIVTLLNGIVQQLKDAQAQNDPAAVAAVIAQLDANSQALADAVTANTPADTGGGGDVPPAAGRKR